METYFNIERFKTEDRIQNKTFCQNGGKFNNFFWVMIPVCMFKKIIMLFEMVNKIVPIFIIYMIIIKKKIWPFFMQVDVMNNLMSRTCQNVYCNFISFVKPERNCSIKLADGGIYFLDCIFFIFTHNNIINWFLVIILEGLGFSKNLTIFGNVTIIF